MGDQQRWFKLWASAPGDSDIQALAPGLRWAWVAFGVHTKVHGTRGRVVVRRTDAVLAASMGVTVEDLFGTIFALPHMVCEEGKNGHGELTVTWQNWVKYQEDSTQAERQRASRAKRRGEEKRREEKRKPPTVPPVTDSTKPIPESIQAALVQTRLLNATKRLWEPAYWQSHIRATNGSVEYAQEILKAEAWLTANPSRAPKKDLARFLGNWLTRAGERV